MNPSLLLRVALCAMLAPLAQAQFPVYELDGALAGDNYGKRLVRIGDLDGDGVDDLLVGAPRSDFNGSNSGSVHAISAASGAELYRVDGSGGGEIFGEALDSLADVNGDGIDDWVVGAPFASSGVVRNGRVELRSGSDGSLIRAIDGNEQFGNLGTAVAGLGDLDGDSVPDFLASSPYEDVNGSDAGALYIYSGATGALIGSQFGPGAQSELGLAVAGLGDVDGDGVEDYAAGTLSANAGAGVVQVWSGQTGLLMRAFDGNAQTGTIGLVFAAVADMNGDGKPELAIGAPGDSSSGSVTGAVRVYSVQSGALVMSVQGQSGELLGFGVGDAGDWDGDGQGDWLVARHGASAQGGALLLSGANGNVLTTLMPAAHNASLGAAFAGGFDIDGDGRAEFCAGDPLADRAANDAGTIVMLSAVNQLGNAFCFGDGTGAACPCGNPGGAGSGCSNSSGTGAQLAADGSASASADDLRLLLTDGVAGKPALLFAGTQNVNGGQGALFGDGLRCAGGMIQRLGVRFSDAQGEAEWGPGIAASGGWISGDTRVFQAWYRDGVNSPCGTQFNLSGALSLHYLP